MDGTNNFLCPFLVSNMPSHFCLNTLCGLTSWPSDDLGENCEIGSAKFQASGEVGFTHSTHDRNTVGLIAYDCIFFLFNTVQFSEIYRISFLDYQIHVILASKVVSQAYLHA